ncbi:mkkA, partial [Symbiodinium pilosum]
GANVLVGLDSLAKLADFGCSKRAKDETTSVTIEGSIPWMAPEVLTHSRYGRAGDIWSFGCLVIEMATADAPWGHFDNLMAAILKIGMSGELPPIPETVSANCKGFIRRCTQHDPGKRLSATELLNEEFVLAVDEEGNFRKKEEAASQAVPACERIDEEVDELLPPGWERHFCSSWSAWYYWHRTSGRSQWVRPNDDEVDVEEESTSQRSGKSSQ